MASPQSLPWYLKDLNQSCDDIFCSEGEDGDEDEEEIGEAYTRYSGPLHFEVVPPAKTRQEAEVIKNQEHVGGNNISILAASYQPVMEHTNLTLGGEPWCYGMSCGIAIGVMVVIITIPCMLLGLRIAITHTPQRRKKRTSNTYKFEWKQKVDFHRPKMSASQKRRKRRRQANGDEPTMPNRVFRSHSVNNTQGPSEGENDSIDTLVQTTTVLSIEKETSSSGNKRQVKDDATDIIKSNRDILNHSPSSSSQIIDGSTTTVAVTNPSDSRSVVIWNDAATPCCLNYSEQVQMIAAVVSATGLDNTTSLTLANQTILRRLETQFMLQQQDQQKEKQNQDQTAEVSPSALGVHHFKYCFVISILVRASILLHRYLVNNHYSSNIFSAIYDYSFKGTNTKITTSSYIMAFLTHVCGCGRQGDPDAIIDADFTRQAEPYVYNILSYYYYYYYYTTKAPSIGSTLLQMQCWAFCFIQWLISGIALYLLHQLLDTFHSPKQLHHLINLTAFLTIFSFQDVVLRLTILHILLLLGTNGLVYVLQRMFYNTKSQIMIKNSAAVVSVITSFLLGFAVN